MLMLFIGFFVFLFCLYTVCRDDFVFLRKNVSTEWLYNMAIMTLGVSLLSARFIYVLFHFDHKFLNPFVFLLFPRYPGLSLTGAILGGVIFLLVLLRAKKVPLGHIFDAFSVSALAAILAGVSISFLILEFILLIILFVILYRLLQKARLRDGSITFLFLTILSILLFLSNVLIGKNNLLSMRDYEDYLLVIIIVFPALLFIKEEKLLEKIKIVKKAKRTLRKFDL